MHCEAQAIAVKPYGYCCRGRPEGIPIPAGRPALSDAHLHNYGIVDLAGHDFSDFYQISGRRFVAI